MDQTAQTAEPQNIEPVSPEPQNVDPASPQTREQLRAAALERKNADPSVEPEPAAQPEPQKPEQNIARTAAALRKLEIEKKELAEQLEQARQRAEVLDRLADPDARLSVLEELGVKYEDLTTDVLKRGGVIQEETIDLEKLPKEVREKLAKIDEMEQKAAEREQKAAEEAKTRRHQEDVEFARNFLQGGDYELAAAFGDQASAAMVELWNRRVAERAERGESPPSPQDIAAEIEQMASERIDGQLGALMKTKKGRAMVEKHFGPLPASDDSPGGSPEPSKPPAITGDTGRGNGAAPRLSNESAAARGDQVDLTTLGKHDLRKRAASKFFGAR